MPTDTTVYNSQNVKVAAGTLYAAPLGATEPQSISGVWDAAWEPLGFTDQGSEFSFGPQTADVMVEEEYFPVRTAIVTYAGDMTFNLAETTRRNLALVLNAGLSGTGAQGAFGDGTLYQDVPTPGSEVRIMLGWDAQYEGAPSGADPFQRLIIRQCFQSQPTKRSNRKGNNKAMWLASFKLEKPGAPQPAGTSPFRYLFNPSMA